jgi:hypothetical protein
VIKSNQKKEALTKIDKERIEGIPSGKNEYDFTTLKPLGSGGFG